MIAKAVAAQQSKKVALKNANQQSKEQKKKGWCNLTLLIYTADSIPQTVEVLTVPPVTVISFPGNQDTVTKMAEILNACILSACLAAEYTSRKRSLFIVLSDTHRKIFGNTAMSKFLHDNALKLLDVPADGNCAYYMYCLCVGWNLSQVGEMRTKLANFMESHRDVFKSLQPQGEVLDHCFHCY